MVAWKGTSARDLHRHGKIQKVWGILRHAASKSEHIRTYQNHKCWQEAEHAGRWEPSQLLQATLLLCWSLWSNDATSCTNELLFRLALSCTCCYSKLLSYSPQICRRLRKPVFWCPHVPKNFPLSHYCSGIKQSSSCFVIAYSQVSTGVSKGCIIEKCSILIGFHAELDAIVQLPTQLG